MNKVLKIMFNLYFSAVALTLCFTPAANPSVIMHYCTVQVGGNCETNTLVQDRILPFEKHKGLNINFTCWSVQPIRWVIHVQSNNSVSSS